MMLQLDSVSVSAASNPLLHEWDLLAGLVAALLLVVQAVYVVYRRKPRDVTSSYLKIRERLTGVFQQSLIEESRAIFAAIDEELPYALVERTDTSYLLGALKGRDLSASVDSDTAIDPPDEQDIDAPVPEPSGTRFDILAYGIARLSEDDDQHVVLRALLQNALGGILVGRVNNLLTGAEKAAQARIAGAEPDLGSTRLNITFAESTVEKLVMLADSMRETRRHRQYFFRGRNYTTIIAPVALVVVLLCLVSMLIDTRWAYWVGAISIVCFFTAVASLLVCVGLALFGAHWLEEMADDADPIKLLRHRSGRMR